MMGGGLSFIPERERERAWRERALDLLQVLHHVALRHVRAEERVEAALVDRGVEDLVLEERLKGREAGLSFVPETRPLERVVEPVMSVTSPWCH